MQKWVIRNYEEKDDETHEPLYWHNEYGWTTHNPTKFTEEESNTVNLPIGGTWERAGLDVTLRGEVDPWYVAVYSVDRCYGGPEEGDWWFDSGELIKVVICKSFDEAHEVKGELEEIYPFTRKRYSVLGGEDYNVGISEHFPPDYFPEEVPHYE